MPSSLSIDGYQIGVPFIENLAKNNCTALLFSFHEHFVKAGIVMDYLLNLEKSAAELQEFYTTEWDKTKNSTA